MVRLKTFWLVALAPYLTQAPVHGGTVRYELPQLRGEYQFNGTGDSGNRRVAQVETPFGYYSSVDSATLVVEGFVTTGKARGDGISREPLEFDLIPSVGASPSFARRLTSVSNTTIGVFRLEDIYPRPFAEPMPLPGPADYTPTSFEVSFSVDPSAFDTRIPRLIGPPPDFMWDSGGIIVDTPIEANVTDAYIILEVQGVPEPMGAFTAVIALLVITVAAGRRGLGALPTSR